VPHDDSPLHHWETALQTFSPREVQARVRAGESPDVIAAESDWPLDKVMRYAEPLLAERAFIAEQAQTVEVRRSGGGATLLQAAHESLGTDPDAGSITWDAYRREDGKWVVSAEYTDGDGSHLARWTYDHLGRNIHPLDDEARALMGVRSLQAAPDVDIAEALDLVAEVPVVREPEGRPRLVAVPDSDDETDDETVEEPVETVEEASQPEAEPEPEPVRADQETIALPHPSLLDEEAEPEPEEPAAAKKTAPARKSRARKTAAKKTSPAAPAAKKTAPKKPRARKGRASVPSWDEILFGATKHDE